MRSLFRGVARFSRLQLGVGYTSCVTLAAFLYGLAGDSHPLIYSLAWFVGIASFSILFTVVTWYRSDEVPGAAFFLAVSTSLGVVVGVVIGLQFVIPSSGMAALLGFGALMGLPIRILVMAFVFAVLVTVGRRFRNVFAPDTIKHESTASSGRAG